MACFLRMILNRFLLGSCVIFIIAGFTVHAADSKDQAPKTQLTAAARPSLDNVRVKAAYMLGTESAEAGIRDILVVKVQDLSGLVNYAKCLSNDKGEQPVPNCTEQKIVLFLDGREMKGIFPESGAPLPEEETLQFHLQRNADSDETWADLLGAPPLDSEKFYKRDTGVSVGFEHGYALPS